MTEQIQKEQQEVDTNEQIALALAGGRSIREAARSAGLSERTVYRRLERKKFRLRVNEIRTEMLNSATSELTSASQSAVRTLVELLEVESPSIRLKAARSILELGPKMRESTELPERLDRLEKLFVESGILVEKLYAI